jgi:hypothetical protein
VALAPPWRRPTLGWLVWSVPSPLDASAAARAALLASQALTVGDARGVYWLPTTAALEALRVALADVELCAVAAKDTADGRASLARTARHALDEVLATEVSRLEALLAERRTPPAALIRALDGLERVGRAAQAWAMALEQPDLSLASVLVDLSQRVDAALTARLVA